MNIVKYELTRTIVRPLYRKLRGKAPLGNSEYDARIPVAKAKAVLRRHGLGFDKNGNPSWWYSAFDGRNSTDELTHFELDFIASNVPKDGDVLITGCGTGLSTIPLAQRGYSNIDAFDYLPNVLESAKEIAAMVGVQVNYWQDNGFKPSLEKKYDCITAVHWLYSAWMGNYTNPVETRADRQAVLTEFLSQYSPALKDGGYLLVELVDSMLDYSVAPFNAYPIRHSVEQVKGAAAATGLSVHKIVSNPHGGRSIVVLYVLRKEAK